MNIKDAAITFLGSGNMAEALVAGLIRTQTVKRENIMTTDIDSKRLELLKSKYSIKTTDDNIKAVERADIVILAVKPQVLEGLLEEAAPVLTDKKLIISIAAGVRTEKIEKFAGKKLRLIRVMPNLPALIQKGVSVLLKSSNAGKKDLSYAEKILSAVGETLEVEDESLLDAVTALSGSGPAYFFYFIEALIKAGETCGLSQDISRKLALATAMGAVAYLSETKEDPAQARVKVTSPGGTTEAALKSLGEKGFSEIVIEAVKSAEKRSRELSQG